jgi:hypothetical protein
MKFNMTNITLEFHRVRPKWFRANGMFGANHAPILHQD